MIFFSNYFWPQGPQSPVFFLLLFMDFSYFLFFHPSSFCLETPPWIRDSPLLRFLVAVSWGWGVLYLSANSIIISTVVRLHSLRSSVHFWASHVHLPAFTAVFVLHSLSRLPPPLPRSVQHYPTSVTGAWPLPLSVLDDLHLGDVGFEPGTSATTVWRSIIWATHPPCYTAQSRIFLTS